MKKYAFLQRSTNEDDWYVCTDLVRKDFEGGYNLRGTVLDAGDKPAMWYLASVLFNTAIWTCWEYETLEELKIDHISELL